MEIKVIKKYLAIVFILFSLAFSFSNINFSQSQRHSIVYITGSNDFKDNVTDGFLKKNEEKKRHIYTVLSIKVFLLNSISEKIYFNSS
ncbi:MAG TPA: hypothetical protein PK294_05720 [Ignavibacteria bacterium]|nr:hypothetical protein [Ignavibacteria bacterium]HQY51274.1 hypothetical protein [Ignavibacteria bacterium]HRA99918.1 hypothetical protein [Ignavibacteria bacterium]